MAVIEPDSPEGESPEDDLSRRERARLEKENRDLRLAMEIQRLGIDPGQGVGKLFATGYDGEVTADAVKAAAEGYGIMPEPTPPPDAPDDPNARGEVTDPNVREMTQDRQTASGGTVPDGGTPSEDPRVIAIREGEASIAVGGTQETAMGAAFDVIAAAGYGGTNPDGTHRAPDPRAQYRPGEIDPRRGQDLGW